MQYPLDGLHLFIRSTLKPSCISNLNMEAHTQSLTEEIVSLTTSARLGICSYLSAAANETQAKYMLHAMHVALLDLLNTIDSYRNAVNKPSASGSQQKEITRLYELVYEETAALVTFLTDNFHNALSVSLPSYLVKQHAAAEHREPLLTNLSVSQLAVFVRLLVDTGIVAEKQAVTALITRTAQFVKTKKTNAISSESLRVKYYTPEQPAINILKEYIAKMMQLLRNY